MTFENATPTWGGYLPEAPLGSGGFSEVWAAREPISGEPVAIKRIPTPDAESRLRVAREVAALRQLRIPGVVRFRDHVSGDGCELIVMDRAPGKPFPNAPPQSPWSQIRAATLSMLRTLSGVHQAGLLHRDLKPANILVDEQGECTLLDFGLARHAYSGDTLTETGLLMGTPRYLAPEVWLGGRPGPAADLFAVGVMLYEALAGRAPYTLDPRRFGERTWQQRPPRLDQLSSGVPTHVAEIVERLLLPDPLSRPSSVAQLERQLYGPETNIGPTLPFLGQGEAMARALEGLREGRSVRIAAPPGMGRRRFLREVAARWAAEAPAPLLLPPTDRAFGSLHAALSLPTPPAEAPLSEAAAVVTAALGTALDAGRRLFIDELDAPDRWSARLTKAMPALRLVAPSEPAEGRLRALEAQELLPLFHGPERIFQIPSDAAAVLHARTGGLPAQVAAEVHAWVRAGRASWENGRLRLDRPTLDRFRAEAARTWAPLTLGAALDEAQNEICAWLGFAGAPLDRAALLSVLPQAAWELDAHLEELAAAGRILRETPEGPVRLSPGAHVNPVWSQAERREAHARMAKLLPPGEPARLRHLLAVGDPAGLSAEAIRRARDLEQLGELGPALAILEEVLPVLAAQGAPLHPLAAPLSRLALAQGRPDVLRRVANRLRREIPESAPLPLLLDRFAELLTGSTLYPEQLWAEIPAFVNPPSDRTVLNTPPQESSESAAELEDWRLGLGVQAAARLGPERLREVLGEVQARRGAPEGPESAARYQGWQAQLLYQEEAYEAAALAHEASARGRTRRDAPAASYAQAASAWLMAGRLDEAERAARLAKEGARLSRSLIWSGWAELRLREVEARAGRATQLDLELVELSERLGNPHLHGLVCLNEAGIAWRRSVPHRARALARSAETALRKAGSHPGALLARALSLRCGETPGEGEIELLAMEAEILPWPGLSVQILALLSPETRADARALLQSWRPSALRIPRELCSGEEILGHLPDEIPTDTAEPTLRLDDAP